MDEDKKNEEMIDEEQEFDEYIIDHIKGLIMAAEELPVDDEAKFNLERLALSWYTETTRTHIEASKLVNDADQKLRDRGSAEEIKQAEIDARKKEQLRQAIFDGIKIGVTILGTTVVPLWVYTKQQNKILAAEYCDKQFVLDKNFADDKAQIMKLISRFNG